MSASRQVRIRESAATPPADPETLTAAPTPARDDLLELLRDAIDRLKSSSGDLPDQAQMANLLAEAGEALERAKAVASAISQCEGLIREAQFDKGIAVLDAGLLVYPADPKLIARRLAAEEQQKAFHSAAAVRTALDEAKWLLDQDRTDLAFQFLNEKATELPDQVELVSRLEELEGLLPLWEQKRHVQATLARAATLEQLNQWQAALTIVEEALQSYPTSDELIGAAKQARAGLAEREHQKKLARRLELIGQKMGAQSWRQALTLLENAEKEFPDAPELKHLRLEVDAGLRRSECEAIVTEVRQCLADGDLEQGEQVLRKGLESFGPEPALAGLSEELVSDRKYREELRKAQVLFGRRQLPEAEQILAQLVSQDRPEARALLDAVREARAATEEEDFCERGREKALELIQQQQFAQAVDLLRNLLSLFPGNAILERDLTIAQSGLEQRAPEVVPPPEQENEEPSPALIAEPPVSGKADPAAGREGTPSRFRRTAIVGTASLVLVSATGAVWKALRKSAPVSRSATPPATNAPSETPLPITQQPGPATVVAPPERLPQPSLPAPTPQPVAAAAAPNKQGMQPARPPADVLRQFVPPGTKPAADQVQNASLPLPPGTEPSISTETISRLPAGLLAPVNAPAPPPAAPAQPVVTDPGPAVKPPATGGRFEGAQLINRVVPLYPALARQRSILGTVQIEARIDERGGVKNVKALSGDSILAAAAMDAVQQWKYKPATLNGVPTASNVTIQVVFGKQAK